jgi:hypothetical protein
MMQPGAFRHSSANARNPPVVERRTSSKRFSRLTLSRNCQAAQEHLQKAIESGAKFAAQKNLKIAILKVGK